MKKRAVLSKARLVVSAVTLGVTGTVGMALVAASPATASPGTVTTTIPDPMTGQLPIVVSNSGTAVACSTNGEGSGSVPFCPTDTVTLPVSVATSQLIEMDQTISFPMPNNLVAAVSNFGATDFSVSSYTSTVDATGATPASVTVSATNTPSSVSTNQAESGIPLLLPQATYTAGPSGTVTFTQDVMTLDATVVGGTLAGDVFAFTLTAGQPPAALPPATLGTVTITSSGTGLPVGPLGGVALAGAGGLGLVVAQPRRTRRFSTAK